MAGAGRTSRPQGWKEREPVVMALTFPYSFRLHSCKHTDFVFSTRTQHHLQNPALSNQTCGPGKCRPGLTASSAQKTTSPRRSFQSDRWVQRPHQARLRNAPQGVRRAPLRSVWMRHGAQRLLLLCTPSFSSVIPAASFCLPGHIMMWIHNTLKLISSSFHQTRTLDKIIE